MGLGAIFGTMWTWYKNLYSSREKNPTMALASSLMDGIARMLYRAPFTYGRIYKLLFKISIHYTIKINHIKYHFIL